MVRTERQQFFARLAVYLMGIAIGCVILGFFSQARQAEAQRQAAARAAAEAAEAAPAGQGAASPK